MLCDLTYMWNLKIKLKNLWKLQKQRVPKDWKGGVGNWEMLVKGTKLQSGRMN